MIRQRRPEILRGVTVILMTGSLLTVSAVPGGGAGREQPIEYNHNLHTQDLGIECSTCHRGVRTTEWAGPPPLEVCLTCHEDALTENPEEHKIQALAAAGRGIEWVRLTYVPDHVYFSHRRHVAVAEVECATCHGPMETQTSPPERPLITLRMSDCMDCHEERGASLDCNACHR